MKKDTLDFIIYFTVICIGLVAIFYFLPDSPKLEIVTEPPQKYFDACDKYYGKSNWNTTLADWIDFDSKFVYLYPDLFYITEDSIGHLHTYVCLRTNISVIK